MHACSDVCVEARRKLESQFSPSTFPRVPRLELRPSGLCGKRLSQQASLTFLTYACGKYQSALLIVNISLTMHRCDFP